jgi:hypothetical protein
VQLKDVVKQCITFIIAWNEYKDIDSANNARYNLWMMKVNKSTNAPKL